MTTEEYLSLITSAHSDKPKFEATVAVGVSPFARTQEVLNSLITEFDIDTAIGEQLDVVGEWVGRSRRIDTPLVGVYFAWDDLASNGWDSGVWKDIYDPDSGLVDLSDDAYRMLLKAKVAANNWDGTIPQAYDVWAAAFGIDIYLLIQDKQDMSIEIGVSGRPLSQLEKVLLVNGFFPLKPEGVRIEHYSIVPEEGSIFVWDSDPSNAVSGWDSGQWPVELIAI